MLIFDRMRSKNASYIQDSTQSFAQYLERLESLAQAISKLPASKNYKNKEYFEVDYNLIKINQGRGFYAEGINSIDTLIGHLSTTLTVEKKNLKRNQKKRKKYKKSANKYRRIILLKYRRKSPFYWRYKIFENELLIHFDSRLKRQNEKPTRFPRS